MSDAYFFGYGSLVNRATHAYSDARTATLHGWRRTWRHAEGRRAAVLTAVPGHDSDRIDGLIAAVPGGDWVALDLREGAYDRIPTHDVRHSAGDGLNIHVYWVPEGKHLLPDRPLPVFLSYLDVVVQGYLNEFGEAGVERFFATTDGWDMPIIDDRAGPFYPRHTMATDREKALTDRHLDALGLVPQSPAISPSE